MRDLYNITKSNCPGFRYSFDQWVTGDACIVCISAADIPTLRPAGIFYPSTLTFQMTYMLNDKHKPLANSQTVALGAITYLPGSTQTCTLSMYYEDAITVSANASVQTALVIPENSGARSSGQVGPAIDGLQVR